MSGSSVRWIVAFVAPRSLRAREVPEDWGPWLHGSHQPQDHRALLIHSGAGVGWCRKAGQREDGSTPQSAVGPFCVPTLRTPPHSLPSKMPVTSLPSHIPLRLGPPRSRLLLRRSQSLLSRLQGCQPGSHHITYLDFQLRLLGE